VGGDGGEEEGADAAGFEGAGGFWGRLVRRSERRRSVLVGVRGAVE
jgi:hypothetical protein